MSEEVTTAPVTTTAAQGENGAAATKPETVLGQAAEQTKPVVAATPAAPAVPEKYELKLPEGSKLDAGYVEKLSAFAKDQKFTQEQAQKLLEQTSADNLASETARAETQKKQLEEWKAGLLTQTQNDPEIGGANLRESVAMASRVLDLYGDAAFRKDLDDTGLGNHPGLVRTLARIGKKHLADDKMVHANASPGGGSIEDRWYPNQTKKE